MCGAYLKLDKAKAFAHEGGRVAHDTNALDRSGGLEVTSQLLVPDRCTSDTCEPVSTQGNDWGMSVVQKGRLPTKAARAMFHVGAYAKSTLR